MPTPGPIRLFIIALVDLLGAACLTCFALFLGPLGMLRGALNLPHIFWYVWVLSPQGLLSRLVRAALDWRLGNFDAAVFQLEFLVGRCEQYAAAKPKVRHLRTVLEDFYTLLARAYLHSGHVDDAMLVILRAKKNLGYERLPGLARLDAKTAHLVRAGLAAGRLLDGTGLATLFVKSVDGNTPQIKQTATTQTTPARQGATAAPPKDGKVIPFRKIRVDNPDVER